MIFNSRNFNFFPLKGEVPKKKRDKVLLNLRSNIVQKFSGGR